jgi:hypothetical protein
MKKFRKELIMKKLNQKNYFFKYLFEKKNIFRLSFNNFGHMGRFTVFYHVKMKK